MSDKKLRDLVNQLLDSETLINSELPPILGQEAVNFYNENFENQGFEGKKWQDVKRRDDKSTWYGFKKDARQAPPNDHPKRNNSKKPYKKRKSNPKTNFAKVATKSPILSSTRSELENSLFFELAPGKVAIKSSKPYAAIQNFGGDVKVFGKKVAKIVPRPFIKESEELNERVSIKFVNKVKKHFNQ